MSPSAVACTDTQHIALVGRETRALSVIHHKHTADYAAHTHHPPAHKEAPKLQLQIEKEAVAIAGAAYKEYHQVGYDELWLHCQPARGQLQQCWRLGRGLADVIEIAPNIATYAVPVAGKATQPLLPYE